MAAVFSKKGGLALGGGAIAAANLTVLEPVTALASLKLAWSVARGELDDLSDFGGAF